MGPVRCRLGPGLEAPRGLQFGYAVALHQSGRPPVRVGGRRTTLAVLHSPCTPLPGVAVTRSHEQPDEPSPRPDAHRMDHVLSTPDATSAGRLGTPRIARRSCQAARRSKRAMKTFDRDTPAAFLLHRGWASVSDHSSFAVRSERNGRVRRLACCRSAASRLRRNTACAAPPRHDSGRRRSVRHPANSRAPTACRHVGRRAGRRIAAARRGEAAEPGARDHRAAADRARLRSCGGVGVRGGVRRERVGDGASGRGRVRFSSIRGGAVSGQRFRRMRRRAISSSSAAGSGGSGVVAHDRFRIRAAASQTDLRLLRRRQNVVPCAS